MSMPSRVFRNRVLWLRREPRTWPEGVRPRVHRRAGCGRIPGQVFIDPQGRVRGPGGVLPVTTLPPVDESEQGGVWVDP